MKITKRQLRRIIKEEKQKLLAENRVRKAVRAALNEITGGSPDPQMGGAGTLARSGGKLVRAAEGGYDTPEGLYVTDSQDHPLDQLQDLINMGVEQVEDLDTDGRIYALRDWIPIVVDAARENDEDQYYGPPKRWRGGR